MKPKISVLLVDDHSMMRFALAEAIAGQRDLIVAGEAGNGEQALALYREHRPDVVTMDFQLPGANGVETTIQIRKEFPDARIVILSVFEGEEDVWRAVEAGVSGYVSKAAEQAEMLDAIREVAKGHNYFPTVIAKRIASRRARQGLTARELQVLRKIVAGRSNKEIMSDLNLSEATVKLHVSNTLAKLQVADRTQAAIQAVRRGIVHLDELPEL